MKKIEEMKMKNGYFAIDGREYILTEQAYFESDPIRGLSDWDFDNYYCARAICLDDEADEDGYQTCYKVRWEILETYDPEYNSDDCACDWDSPSGLKDVGEYSPVTDWYY